MTTGTPAAGSAPTQPDRPRAVVGPATCDRHAAREPGAPHPLGEPCGSCGPSRRRVLQGGAVGAGVLVLAACTPSDAPGTTPVPADDGDGLVALADVPVGGAVVVQTGDGPVVVTQPADGDLVGFSGICTHQGCTVVADEDQGVVCPCHGSVFDVATGEALRGPASVPLPQVELEVRDGRVHLA